MVQMKVHCLLLIADCVLAVFLDEAQCRPNKQNKQVNYGRSCQDFMHKYNYKNAADNLNRMNTKC